MTRPVSNNPPVTNPMPTPNTPTVPTNNPLPSATGISSLDCDDSLIAMQVSAKMAMASSGLNVEFTAAEQTYINSLSPDQLKQLSSVVGAVTATVGAGVSGAPAEAVSALEGPLQDKWTDFVTRMKIAGGAVDINALVQWVLRESYQETTEDLYFYAEKVKFFNAVKKEIRAELKAARNELAKLAGAEDTAAASFGITPINMEFTGSEEVLGNVSTYKDPTTKAELETYIQNLEEDLSSVGDDAQLANVDLQNMLQKQQQTMQMMSNIAKMLHDTAMAIIRKIGG